MCLNLNLEGVSLIYEEEKVYEVIGKLKMMHHDASHHDVMHHDVESCGSYFL